MIATTTMKKDLNHLLFVEGKDDLLGHRPFIDGFLQLLNVKQTMNYFLNMLTTQEKIEIERKIVAREEKIAKDEFKETPQVPELKGKDVNEAILASKKAFVLGKLSESYRVYNTKSTLKTTGKKKSSLGSTATGSQVSTPQSEGNAGSIQEMDSKTEESPRHSPKASKGTKRSIFANTNRRNEIPEASSREDSRDDSHPRNESQGNKGNEDDDGDDKKPTISIMDQIRKGKPLSFRNRPNPNAANAGESTQDSGRFRSPRPHVEDNQEPAKGTGESDGKDSVNNSATNSPVLGGEPKNKLKSTRSLFGSKFQKAQQAEEALKTLAQGNEKANPVEILEKVAAEKKEDPSSVKSEGAVRIIPIAETRLLNTDKVHTETVSVKPMSSYMSAILSKPSKGTDSDNANTPTNRFTSPVVSPVKNVESEAVSQPSALALEKKTGSNAQGNEEANIHLIERRAHHKFTQITKKSPGLFGTHLSNHLHHHHHHNHNQEGGGDSNKSKRDEFRKLKGLTPIKTMRQFMGFDDLAVKKSNEHSLSKEALQSKLKSIQENEVSPDSSCNFNFCIIIRS